jgi:hypothetical protein
MGKIQVVVKEDQEIPIYKWCAFSFEYFTADRKNYICYEYKWAQLSVDSLDDFSLTPVPDTNNEWFVIEGGDISGDVGGETHHFANEELEERFDEIYGAEDCDLYSDEIFWEIVKDYPTETMEDYECWLRLDPEHKEMIEAFSPYIKEADYE